MRVAIGCRDHSGWAVLVGIGGDAAAPTVLTRDRVELIDDALPRMAYHAALELDVDAGAQLIAQVERSAEACAERALSHLAGRLRDSGYDVAGVGIAIGTSPPPDDLAKILGSHTLLHAAEGELYRDALVAGAESADLPVTRYANKRAISELAATLQVDTDALAERLAGLRRTLGAPWQKDHREATAAALLVLGG
jgi:hypothetical protein